MAWTGSQHDRNRRWGWTDKLLRFKQHVVILSLKPPEIYLFNLWILMVIIRFQSAWQMISQIDTRGFLFVRQPVSAVGKTIFCCIHEYFGNSQALHRPWTQDDGARPNDFVLLQCAAKSSSLAWIIGYDTFLLLSPTSNWCVSNGSHAVRMTLLLLVFYFDGNSSHHAHPDDTCTLQILLRTGHTGLLLHDRAAVYLWAGLPRGI